MLKHKALLTEAEFLLGAGRYSEFRPALNAALAHFDGESPQFHVQYERILCLAAASAGDAETARNHFERAGRISQTFQLVAAEFEINKWHDEWISHSVGVYASMPQDRVTPNNAGAVLQSIASMAANVSRPELVGRETLAILDWAGCAESAVLTSRSENDNRVLAVIGQAE